MNAISGRSNILARGLVIRNEPVLPLPVICDAHGLSELERLPAGELA